MFGTTLTFAASSIFALSLAAPVRLNTLTPSALVARDNYVMFGGDGSAAAGWPKKSEWLPFEKAWAANLKVIQQSCVNNGWGKNNDDTETQAIKDSIIAESASSGIPKEFILAVMVQESKGCVRVPTTSWDFANPGLMQSSGQASCNPSGTPISPCPADVIRAMIHEGTAGQGLRTTLKNSLEAFSSADDSKWYKAARRYNAGEVLMDVNNLGIGPTKCYASDIANRLVQPFGDSSCNANVIATLSSAQGHISTSNQQNDDKPANDEYKESTPTAKEPAPATPTAATPQPATPQPATPGKESPADDDKEDDKKKDGNAKTSDPIIDGAAKGCTKYYTPVKGDTCETAPIAFVTLRQLNSQLNDKCTNLWAGYAYCIAA